MSSGDYWILLDNKPLKVYCDMKADGVCSYDLYALEKLFIDFSKSYHFCDNFSSKMVTFSARNTNIFASVLYFPYFTTFRHQTLQFY